MKAGRIITKSSGPSSVFTEEGLRFVPSGVDSEEWVKGGRLHRSISSPQGTPSDKRPVPPCRDTSTVMTEVTSPLIGSGPNVLLTIG